MKRKALSLALIALLFTSEAFGFMAPPAHRPHITRPAVAAAGAASDMTDTFTEGSDTTLASHTADTGQTWTFVGASANTFQVVGASDKLINVGGSPDGGYGYQSSFVPSDADYCTEMDVHLAGAIGENSVAIVVRQTLGDVEGVFMYYAAGTGWQIFLNSGGLTQIGSTYAGDTPSTVQTMRLCVSGAGSYTGYINGVSRITGTNTTLAGPGRPGLHSEIAGTNGGNIFDNFKVYNTAP